MRRSAFIAVAIAGIAWSQTEPAFEVSRGSSTQNARTRVFRTPEKLTFQNTHAGDIVAFAYQLPLDRVEHRPQWMYDTTWNVAVTTPTAATLAEQRLIVQKLLEQRFGLLAHRTSYPSPVYHLVATKTPKLTPADDAETAKVAQDPFVLDHASMADLAAWLSPFMQLPVLDKTGITGTFDLQIGMPARADSERIIAVLQDSLGLTLERHSGTAESLIIDQATEPR